MSALYVSGMATSREGRPVLAINQCLCASQRVAQVTQLRWKDKPGLSLKSDVNPYHFAIDRGQRERDECSPHLCLSQEEAKTG